jgi:hypothetical protein
MLTKFLNSTDSSALRQQSREQASSNKRFGKKLPVAFVVLVIIGVVTAAILLVPSSEAEIISLDAHYVPGEKLTYDITVSSSSQNGNSSTNSSTQSTLTVEVVSINEDTYTLKYTTISSTEDNSTTTSYLMDVKETDMINLLTLVPVAYQQYPDYAEYADRSSPIETAFFNQSEAKVGDILRIPSTCTVTATPEAEITVKFVAVQNLAVKAGNFEVFKIEFTRTSSQQSQNQPDNLEYAGVSGESYLEFGSCKQVQSTVQFNMTTSLGDNSGYSSAVTTFSSTLIKDETQAVPTPKMAILNEKVVLIIVAALILSLATVFTRRKRK